MIALLSTCCVNSCIHLYSGGKLLSDLVNILSQNVIKNKWSHFSTCCCVNSCIHLYSDCKLFSYLVNILSQDMWLRMNDCSSLHMNSCIHFCSVCKLLSHLVNILKQDVWLRMNDCSSLHMLSCELIHSLACAQHVSFIFG